MLIVAQTFIVVSPINMDCIKPKTSALGSILEKLVHYKSKVRKRKQLVFFVKCLISRLLDLGGPK